jgi:hypothetical protein
MDSKSLHNEAWCIKDLLYMVMLLYGWRSVIQYILVPSPSGSCYQILLPVWMFLSESCCLVSMRRPFWREDGSAVCSRIIQWSKSCRIRNHTLLSHLRLPQPVGPGCLIYIPQEHGGPVIPPSNGFPIRRLLRLTGLQWRYEYSNPPPHGESNFKL